MINEDPSSLEGIPTERYRMTPGTTMTKIEWDRAHPSHVKYYVRSGGRAFYLAGEIAEFAFTNFCGSSVIDHDVCILNDGWCVLLGLAEREQQLVNKLVDLGIVEQFGQICVPGRNIQRDATQRYVKHRISVVPSALLNRILRITRTLYTPAAAASVFVIGTLLCAIEIARSSIFLLHPIAHVSQGLLDLNGVQFTTLMMIGILASLFHEMGHASAAVKFGLQSPKVSFGVYLVMPVLVTDVTDAWSLPPSKRILINLGGVYFEFFFIAVLSAFNIFFSNQTLTLAFYIILFSIVSNLIPVLRTDGYWIYSDLFSLNNLTKNVSQLYLRILQSLFFWKRRTELPWPIPKSRAFRLYASLLPFVLMLFTALGVSFYYQFFLGIRQIFHSLVIQPKFGTITHAVIALLYLYGLLSALLLVVRFFYRNLRKIRSYL